MDKIRRTRKFCTRYFHDGTWWAADIQAYDFEDAEIRCKKLGMQLDGVHVLTLPSWIGFWAADLIIGIRNFFFGGKHG